MWIRCRQFFAYALFDLLLLLKDLVRARLSMLLLHPTAQALATDCAVALELGVPILLLFETSEDPARHATPFGSIIWATPPQVQTGGENPNPNPEPNHHPPAR